MYDYESIFDICIENDAMKEEVSAAKKTCWNAARCAKHVDAMMIKCDWCSDKVL